MARALIGPIARQLEGIATVSIVECKSVIGSGALPMRSLPSLGLAIRPLGKSKGGGTLVGRISAAFGALPTPVIGRISDGAFVLDLRCLNEADELLELVRQLRVEL